MKLLLTGASGFLGSVIIEALSKYKITRLGHKPSNMVICDLSTEVPQLGEFDYVVHAAAKVHEVPKTNKESEDFFKLNYQGTVNLTKAIEKSGLPKSLVFISSVAVYGVEKGNNIDEEYPLDGSTPYAKSKIAAEEHLIDWGKRNNVKVTILRLPLIAAPDPPGNLGSMKKALLKGYYFRLGSGNARKSIVWAADVANIMPRCFETTGIFNLTDGRDPSIRELDVTIGARYNSNIRVLPLWLVELMAVPSKLFPFWPLNKDRINKLTFSLTFSSEKAKRELGWQPKSVIDCINDYGI